MKLDSAAFVADQDLIRALRERSTQVNCEQDRVLFNQGDEPTGIYILHHGDVTLTMKSAIGEVVMSMLAEAGSLLGLPALIGNEGYSLSAKALPGAEVSFVNREEFSRLMLTEPQLAVMILRVLAAEVRTARMALANL